MGLIDVINVLAPGATVAALGADTTDATGQGATTFAFAPSSGRDLATGFELSGPDHNNRELSGSNFASLAQVLRQTRETGTCTLITVRATGDTITLAGVTEADFAAERAKGRRVWGLNIVASFGVRFPSRAPDPLASSQGCARRTSASKRCRRLLELPS